MRNIIQVTMLGSILDLFQSINMFALLNILSEEADDARLLNIALQLLISWDTQVCSLSTIEVDLSSYEGISY